MGRRKVSITAEIFLWDSLVGTAAWDPKSSLGSFQYSDAFIRSGIELAPIHLPLGKQVYSFPALAIESFSGLPGFLADSLPDKFGHLLIDQWLASQGRQPDSFTPIERLCYIGTRGMGALEFRPEQRGGFSGSKQIEVNALVSLANAAIAQKANLNVELGNANAHEAMNDIIRVGTSAGGARAKAVIAWNRATNQVRSGQMDAPEGFTHWLLKLDGVSGNKDKEVADPLGYGKIEYAYHLMAKEAGIEMMECRLFEEGGRSHFMTRRFDRGPKGEKYHVQTLCGLAHFDFNQAGAYSYEQACQVMRQLQLPYADIEEQYRRAVFNILSRNQDDHTKNIAFLMNRDGDWRLSPAYDVAYSYNPDGTWTNRHQMTLNGKRERFTRDNLEDAAQTIGIKPKRASSIIERTAETLAQWPRFAEDAAVPENWSASIEKAHRKL